jgi:RimJ/RimL family protein N-acetyltransferase
MRVSTEPWRTDRLLLRRFTAGDVEDLVALHGDAAVMRFIDDGRPVPREIVASRTLPAIIAEYSTLPAGLGRYAVVIGASDAFAGWVSLRPATSRGLSGDDVELGYRLRPALWGRGYATEAARAIVRRGFEHIGVERVVATTMTVNTASRHVMEKVGMRFVRTFFEDWPEPIPGAEHGDVEYALTRQDWIAHDAR